MNLLTPLTRFAASCQEQPFFGIPSWHKYLPKNDDCSIAIDFNKNPNDFWLIIFGVIDILLYLAGILAVVYLIYGGVQYMISQGEPDKTNAAKTIILNAVIGLVIVLVAIPVVGFVARSL